MVINVNNFWIIVGFFIKLLKDCIVEFVKVFVNGDDFLCYRLFWYLEFFKIFIVYIGEIEYVLGFYKI